ncbi:hypothetical protein QJS10_CPB11g00953 [Acorus calamus]|uniref:Uncharacterized protein n=1 Tax=Acorus calamus TaxID=4465 RepID=A0AAV9DV09_ACOCL|nr:hypothetical protein QJS10_CPB11g00953 [Acorus calamus]
MSPPAPHMSVAATLSATGNSTRTSSPATGGAARSFPSHRGTAFEPPSSPPRGYPFRASRAALSAFPPPSKETSPGRDRVCPEPTPGGLGGDQ